MQNQQQNKQIANPSTGQLPKVKTPEMNERDFMNDGLSTCKYLTDSLNVAVREASHDQLYQEFLQILEETHQSSRDLFNLMFKKGWYKLEAAEQQKVDQAHQQFSNYSTQFPYQ
ncbi:spore coat protein [Robertmurraya sp. DFI.2.37]|uniref:spore coat protein n=1 Tax=Robertmurraya sp. DFI.2.37 TaxID=3031819 RepID=UPI001248D037|nr:spore coat protein [Robertmurraya sp. DFI.2.37]MDF1508551.1 spore coat protein [Robertmurraya sp. DFI.2.37]